MHGIILGFKQSMKNSFFTILVLIAACFIPIKSFSQEYHGNIALARVVEGDTLIIMNLPTVDITSTMIFKNKREVRRYSRLVRHVQKVYPYARTAGDLLLEYSIILEQAKTDKERRRITKQAEQELLDQYGPELKKLTFTQGKILLKLVDRETGNNSYALVQDLRGKFAAFFWQGLARIFGYNLKVKYDPDGEDRDIEMIVQMIERGEL